MPVTLAKMASNTARVTFSFGEDSVSVDYYPAKVTEKIFAELQAFINMTPETMMEDFAAFNDILASLIKSWDVYEDEACTIIFPVRSERLAELPFAFRVQLLQAIIGDVRPPEAPAATRLLH